jgi:hypothetical protein
MASHRGRHQDDAGTASELMPRVSAAERPAADFRGIAAPWNLLQDSEFYWSLLVSRAAVGGEECLVMATQIVMDRYGDTRHTFDAEDVKSVLRAEARFRKLTGLGFTAAVRSASGDIEIARSFDPGAEETLFFPRLVGG